MPGMADSLKSVISDEMDPKPAKESDDDASDTVGLNPKPFDKTSGKDVEADPGEYGAEGDPYTYRVEPDGAVTIVSGPTGEGVRLDSGHAFDVILAQIKSGQLSRKSDAAPPAEKPAEERPKGLAGGSMKDRTMSAIDEEMGDDIERPPTSKDLPPNMRTAR